MNNIEQDIIRRCQQGDRQAFRAVVEKYQQMVFTLAFRMLCNEDDAKDVTQDTLIRVWLNFARYDATQSLSTWIYTIASHLCLDRLRHDSRTIPLPDDDEQLLHFASEGDASSHLENEELGAVLRSLVQRLSPKQRLVFTLSQFEGLQSSEIEKITDLSADQVKSNLWLARKAIREHLKRLGYE